MPDYQKAGQRDLLEQIAMNTGGSSGLPMNVISKYKTQERIVPEFTLTANVIRNETITDRDIELVVTSGTIWVDFVDVVSTTTGFMCNQGTVIQMHVASRISMIATATAKAQIMVYSN